MSPLHVWSISVGRGGLLQARGITVLVVLTGLAGSGRVWQGACTCDGLFATDAWLVCATPRACGAGVSSTQAALDWSEHGWRAAATTQGSATAASARPTGMPAHATTLVPAIICHHCC